jgi:glycosyltransferase involved in cell wall biosynthesis
MERISVITICFNNLEDLQATCLSVDVQNHAPFEHLIIDGSTNTDIAEWLLTNSQPLYRKWIIERDKGISDAFNKGIRNAKGSIIHLLNSGDTYYGPEVLKMVFTYFQKHNSVSWISGRIYMKRGGIWVHVGVPFSPQQLYKGMRSVSHPTYFLRATVYERVGLFLEKHKIAMDYDLLCRLKGESYAYIDETLIRFDDKGISTTSYLKSLKENIKVYESHFGFSFRCRLWQFRLKVLYWILQSRFGKFLFKIKSMISK